MTPPHSLSLSATLASVARALVRAPLVLVLALCPFAACGGDDGGGASPGGTGVNGCAALNDCCTAGKFASVAARQTCFDTVSSNVDATCSAQLGDFQAEGVCAKTAGTGAGGAPIGGFGGSGAMGVGATGAGAMGAGAMGTGAMGTGAMGTGAMGTGAGPGAGGTASGGPIYCGAADATECSCGTAPAMGWSTSGACSAANVPGPSLCCAASNWPNTDPNVFSGLGCVCSQVRCLESSAKDFCSCGFATASAGDQPVSSCSGMVCCRSKSVLAPTCYCFKSSTVKCSDIGSSDEPVSSCGVSDVQCGGGGTTVEACK